LPFWGTQWAKTPQLTPFFPNLMVFGVDSLGCFNLLSLAFWGCCYHRTNWGGHPIFWFISPFC
jgi:hypothetical protein